MNYFQQAGAFLKTQFTTAKDFLFPSQTPRASQSSLTQQASLTTLSQQKQSQNSSFFGRISSGFKSAIDGAKQAFNSAVTSVRTPKEIKTLQKEAVTAASSLATQGIRTLADVLGQKIASVGQSGTPVDIRPSVADKSISTQQGGGIPNFFGGFEFPFLGSSVGQGSDVPIPIVPDTEGQAGTSSSTVVTNDGNNSLILLAIVGIILFFVFKGKK